VGEVIVLESDLLVDSSEYEETTITPEDKSANDTPQPSLNDQEYFGTTKKEIRKMAESVKVKGRKGWT
jgi:hypothetical protein